MLSIEGGHSEEKKVIKKDGFLKVFKNFTLFNEERKRNSIYSKEADSFLASNFYGYFLKLMLTGYKPNKKQQKQWDNHIKSIVEKSDFSVLNNYLEEGLEFTTTIFDLCFANKKFMNAVLKGRSEDFNTYTNKNIKMVNFTSDNTLLNCIRNILNSEEFKASFPKNWLKEVKYNNKEFKDLYDERFGFFHLYDLSENVITGLLNKTIGLSDILFEGISYEDYMEYTKHSSVLIKNVKDGLKMSEKKHKGSKYVEMMERVEEANNVINQYMDEVGKQNQIVRLLEFNKVDYSELKKPELPVEIINCLSIIEDKYNKMREHKNLSAEEAMSRTIEDQVPKIIKKFLSINDEYKNKLITVNGLNAIDLTIDSLKNIEKKLDEKLTIINEEHLHNLNALNKYTKNI